jgi:DNA-binding beta-propeller fold protein YncE
LDAAVNPVTGDVYVVTRGPLVGVAGPDERVTSLEIEAVAVDIDVQREVAYAATRDGQVAVLEGDEVVALVSAGHRPVGIAVDSESGRVYVANFGSDTVTLIEPAGGGSQGANKIYLPLLVR